MSCFTSLRCIVCVWCLDNQSFIRMLDLEPSLFVVRDISILGLSCCLHSVDAVTVLPTHASTQLVPAHVVDLLGLLPIRHVLLRDGDREFPGADLQHTAPLATPIGTTHPPPTHLEPPVVAAVVDVHLGVDGGELAGAAADLELPLVVGVGLGHEIIDQRILFVQLDLYLLRGLPVAHQLPPHGHALLGPDDAEGGVGAVGLEDQCRSAQKYKEGGGC